MRRNLAGLLAALCAVSLLPACSSGHHADPRAFCAASDRARQLGQEIQSSSLDDRAGVQAKVHAASTAASTAADKAPDDIRHDTQVLADALAHFDTQVAAATTSEELTRAFTTYNDTAENLTAASDAVERWVQRNCSSSSSSTTTR